MRTTTEDAPVPAPARAPGGTTLSRRQFAALSFFTGAGLALGVAPSPALARALRLHADPTPFSWKEIAPGVKVAGEQGGNALVLVAGGQALLVDCKNPPYGPALRRDASAMGGTLTTVVNTHHHADHTGGNAAFTNNLSVIAHEKGAPRTKAQIVRYKAALEGVPADSEFSKDPRAMLDALASRGEDAWAPTRTITTREELQIGGERVVLEPIGPAHTDNDLAVFLPGKNILHTGDLCFHKLHPFVDPSGGSDIEGWIRACDRLMQIANASTVVVPGHGEVTDRAGLEGQKKFLVALREFVTKQIRDGRTAEEVREMRVPGYETLGFEQIRPFTMSGAYAVLKGAAGDR